MSVTVNDVVNGVINAIQPVFPNIVIYGEESAQGFTAPCFYVKLFPVEQKRELNRRYVRRHSFDIHYFGTSNTDMYDKAESLYAVLEYINVNETMCRGKSMKHEILEGVLHFYVDYDFSIMRPKETVPFMQTMNQEANIKND